MSQRAIIPKFANIVPALVDAMAVLELKVSDRTITNLKQVVTGYKGLPASQDITLPQIVSFVLPYLDALLQIRSLMMHYTGVINVRRH